MRGVSGGQRRRVSVGEMLLGCPRAVFLDEVTSGLDASTAFQLVCAMKQWARIAKAPVCMALLQPTPQMVEMFDKIVLMLEGNVVFSGTLAELRNHWSSVGIPLPPEGEPIAEWAVKLLAEPDNFVRKVENDRKIRAGLGRPEQVRANNEVRFHLESEDDSTVVAVPIANAPVNISKASVNHMLPRSAESAVKPSSLTGEGMLADWEESPLHRKLISEIEGLHAAGSTNAQSLLTKAPQQSAFVKSQFYSASSISFGAQTRLLLVREFKSVLRNSDVVVYRILQAILMGQ